MKTLLLVLFSLAFANCQYLKGCPSSVKIIPCSCKRGKDARPWITCNNIKSVDVFLKAVKGMDGLSVSNFHLDNSNIGVLPSDVFSNMEIQTLNIIGTKLTKVGESRNRPPFLGLENSLELLEIKNAFVSKDSPLSILSLSHLKKLSTFQLNNNVVPTIGNNWFESGPYGLRNLILHNTSTSAVGSHVFEALENLRTITFNGGHLSNITRNMLPSPATFLERIDLRMNQLEVLPDDMFSKMPSLEEVYLENNKLTTINEVAFAPIWSQLVTANFDGNPLICDSKMKWIYKYRAPETLRGRCAGPENLKNKDLATLKLSDLQ